MSLGRRTDLGEGVAAVGVGLGLSCRWAGRGDMFVDGVLLGRGWRRAKSEDLDGEELQSAELVFCVDVDNED